MNNRRLAIGITLSAVLAAACSTGGTATTSPTSAAATTPAATSGSVATAPPATTPIVLPSVPAGAAAFAVFEAKPGATPAVKGGAALFDTGGKTQVVIAVDAMGETMAASIQAGTCGSLTPEIAYRLTEVKSGASTTTVDVPLATLLATPYAINISVAGSETESSLTCGAIQAVPTP
jgi:hypothetical protein